VTGYILRRLGVSAVVVLIVSAITFSLLHVLSSSPGRVLLGLHASPAAVAAFNRANGYDDPIVAQYWHYLLQLAHGNLGYSYKANQSVDSLLRETAGRSALLSGAALVLAVAIAVPLGVYQAVRRNSIGDHVATTVVFTMYSMPPFFLALLLIEIFALKLNWLPSEASQAQSVLGVLSDPKGMILPVASLTLISIAAFSRYMRSSALEQLAQDYIRLARAKGLPERLVLGRHLLRNACLPMVTLIGLSIPALLAGNLLIETVFNYNGTGLLFFNSLKSEDYPVLLAYTLIGGVLTVLGNLIADIAVGIADPRVRRT
jgi:peptide/nickel transport system permease protein